MYFIKPDEISAKILSLLEESNEYVWIVSPYVKISKWHKLTKKLSRLKQRGIQLEFIIRDDKSNSNSFEELEQLGIKFRAIENLHCKLYLNEKKAIFSSMNLLLSSEMNSLELGYETETKEEHRELYNFCVNFLDIENSATATVEFEDVLAHKLSELTDKKIRIQMKDGAIRINTRTNNYSCLLQHSSGFSSLLIAGILSVKEFKALHKNPLSLTGFDLEAHEGDSNEYDQIWGHRESQFKSTSLESILSEECESIANSIFDFIQCVDHFKKGLR